MKSKAQKAIEQSNKVLKNLSDKQYEQYNFSTFTQEQKEQFISFAKKGGITQGKINGKYAVESGQLDDARIKATEAHKNNNYVHQKKIASLGGLVSANDPNHVNKKKCICPYCNKLGSYIAMKRWHFDNCKHKK